MVDDFSVSFFQVFCFLWEPCSEINREVQGPLRTNQENMLCINSTVTESHSEPLFHVLLAVIQYSTLRIILLNGILPDHYILKVSTESAYGKYVANDSHIGIMGKIASKQ